MSDSAIIIRLPERTYTESCEGWRKRVRRWAKRKPWRCAEDCQQHDFNKPKITFQTETGAA